MMNQFIGCLSREVLTISTLLAPLPFPLLVNPRTRPEDGETNRDHENDRDPVRGVPA